MTGKADPRGRVDRQAHVSRVGQGRTPGVQADPNANRNSVRPGSSPDLALDGQRGVETGACLLEDCEHLVTPGLDFAATGGSNRRPEQASSIGEEPPIFVAKPAYETRRVLDIAEEKRHDSGRQRTPLARACLDLAMHPLVFGSEPHGTTH